jgi:hypothetical protein
MANLRYIASRRQAVGPVIIELFFIAPGAKPPAGNILVLFRDRPVAANVEVTVGLVLRVKGQCPL